jgi:excisionase family DNA binding protein
MSTARQATTTTPPTKRRLASRAEAADYARCSIDTIRRRISDGTITGYRSGPRVIVVDLDEIDAKLLKPIPTVGGAA